MKIVIDTKRNYIEFEDGKGLPLYCDQGFEILSKLWMKVGWNQRVPYTYSWLGMPILQLPDDMIRMQEVIWRLKPDLIIETGVAHGGSMIFYASLCQMMGHGQVIGIEKGLRCREAVKSHPLGSQVHLIEGDSTAPDVVGRVHALASGHTVLMILDSNHSKLHVAKELECYHDLIQPGSYIVATDGNMVDLADVPRGSKDWTWNNPQAAALEFADRHPEFVIEQPAWPFNESGLTKNTTYWPNAWLKRLSKDEIRSTPQPTKEIEHEQA
jgi:cephalosporin hydroxylase